MEKLVWSLIGAKSLDRHELAANLRRAGATRIRINLRDEAVTPAAPLVQQCSPRLPDGVVQFWLPTANPAFRAETDAILGQHCEQMHGWLVSEATIIANADHPAAPGGRTHGFAQLAFLTLPDGMPWAQWRATWRDFHTRVAIETQSNFEYIQNLVVEPLTEGAPPFVGIVEECFPPEAMTDPMAFFDAVGDPDKFKRNLGRMMDSCARFITPGTIDVFATSQYDHADPAALP